MRYIFTVNLLLASAALAARPGDWAFWRGAESDGMARGDAQLHWSDSENIAWKATVPGRGHSSPVVWGDRIFVTTAVPTGSGALPEHKFVVLCFDRNTGKLLWEKVARTAAPHEGPFAGWPPRPREASTVLPGCHSSPRFE